MAITAFLKFVTLMFQRRENDWKTWNYSDFFDFEGGGMGTFLMAGNVLERDRHAIAGVFFDLRV